MQKLSSDQLYRFTSFKPQDFSNSEIDTHTFMQEFHPRAFQALNYGLFLKRNHNHVFVMGESGVGRIGMTKELLNRAAKAKPRPSDVVLVADFADVSKTKYLYFPAGRGVKFKQDIENFIAHLKSQLPLVFDGYAYQQRSQLLERGLNEKQEEVLAPAFELATELGINIQQTDNSFVLNALVDDEKLSLQEVKALEPEQRDYFTEALDRVELALNEGFTRFPTIQHEFMLAGKELNTQVAHENISPLIDVLKQDFGDQDDVVSYLDELQQEVVAKLHLFWDQSSEEVTSASKTNQNFSEFLAQQQGMSQFGVNLLVDHSGLDQAPVIYDSHATTPKLFGYAINSASAHQGDTLTLAMSHQAGLLQKANGGFLILTIESLIKEPDLWDSLKAALMARVLSFEIPAASNIVPYHLPDFPLDITVVLVGKAVHFYLLQELDSQFGRLFKVQVEFEQEIERTLKNEVALAKQLSAEIADWETLPITLDAYEALLEYSCRLAEKQDRIYTNKAVLRDLIAQANAKALVDGVEKIDRSLLEETLEQIKFSVGQVEDYFHRLIVENQVLVGIDGSKVGQINALTVMSLGDNAFGQPARVTAQVSAGDEGVLDIEREIEMSGPIHSKGVLILNGYLRGKYMREKSWGFSASIVLEQTYDGIDGDSASLAELAALISSLINLPIRQDLAITGSISQMGEVQPIGGANEKIEGFFKICQAKGLTGNQGVIIPAANQRSLMLSAEVREAVEQDRFAIYTVENVDEALELLLEVKDIDKKVIAALEEINPKKDDA